MISKWLGTLKYTDSLALHNEKSESIFGLEHEPTITLGCRGDSAVDIKSESPLGLLEGFEVIKSERGGHATLHSPGQLVIYPLIHIRKRNIRVRDYVAMLEEATIRTLESYDIIVKRRHNEPGLYTANGKIAFFGIRVKEGKTSHGLSINVNNDLGLFRHIRSCGREHEEFDKLQNYGSQWNLKDLFHTWSNNFQELLEAQSCVVPSLTKTPIAPILAQTTAIEFS